MIEELQHGLVEDTPDARDFQASDIMGAVTVDWTKEFRLPAPPDFDQGQSDACVACASSYYHWQLKNKVFSKRDLFCRIYLAYGASLRDGVKEIAKNGQATEEEVPDPIVPTATNMRDKTGTDQSLRNDDIESNYFVLPQGDINGVAWGLSQYKGVTFGVYGSNQGWQDMENPRPPRAGETVWGHALYAMGYHIHAGQKCIIAKSSWCKSVKEHHINETYFTALQGVMNAWVLIPKQLTTTIMYKKAVHADGKTYAVLIITPNGSQVINATTEEEWKSFSKADSYQLSTVNADGSANYSDCIQLPW